MADALVKKKKKNVKIEEEDEEEAGLAELLDNTHTPTASPKSKPKKKINAWSLEALRLAQFLQEPSAPGTVEQQLPPRVDMAVRSDRV
jgi:hypothetical protein